MDIIHEAIIISSDHAGFELKEALKREFDILKIKYKDAGTFSKDSVDYPVFAGAVARAVSKGEYAKGITICGTGIGASIAANRFRKVRAALCSNEIMAKLSREHNNSNILVLGARIVSEQCALNIVNTWLSTSFEGGRHEKRIALLDTLE